MKFFSKIIFLILAIVIVACSESTNINSSSEDDPLEKNTEWPIELIGTLDIVEGGGEDIYMTWAVGSFLTSIGEIPIYLDSNAAVNNRVDLDAHGEFKVWLGKPRNEYGYAEYEIIKIEKI